MKSKVTPIVSIFIIVFMGIGCKKEQQFSSNAVATLNVINGVINTPALIKIDGVINTSGNLSSSSGISLISYGSNAIYNVSPTSKKIQFLKYPDSSILISADKEIKNGGIYSIFLTGTSISPEAVWIDDTNLPIFNLSKIPSEADSVLNIRFVNLAQDVSSIDVRIKNSTTNEVVALQYKNVSAFKSYPAKTINPSYVFEILNNGNVIFTQSLSVLSGVRFKCISYVLTGFKTPPSGSPSLALTRVNYYQ